MNRDAVARVQLAKLRALLREILPRNPFYRGKLAGSGAEEAAAATGEVALAGAADSLASLLASLPLTTKRELQDDQVAHPPWGTNLTYEPSAYTRIHRTSGTTGRSLCWLDTAQSWQWFVDCWKAVWRGVGLRGDDRLLFPFSFGPFIGFWGAFESASQLGRFCLPAGGMSSSARLGYLTDYDISMVACTPTYALRLAEVAESEGVDLKSSAVRAIIVAGEPGGCIPATRARIEEAWGARCLDHHGMTEIGAVSFESPDRPGSLRVIESEFIVEVLDPDGAEPAAEGELGELVLTNLGRVGSPLIRYRTGDLVRWRSDEPDCDNEVDGGGALLATTGRLDGGILGRVDDMFFIRGNNVFPAAIEAVVREFPEVAEYRLRVLQSGELTTLRLELEPHREIGGEPSDDRARSAGTLAAGETLARKVARAVQDRLLFRADVALVEPGTLPRFELKARRLIRETGQE